MNYDQDYADCEFAMYDRKSSEDDERQALSIESQRERNYKTAKNLDIKVKKSNVYEEAKSAKNAGTRPEFNRMVKDVEGERVQGIIAWHADRLSRNAVDSAILIDQMDRGKLLYIVTPMQVFKNTPSDKFFFSMLCSQAKMENDSKGVNVKRGLVKKREMGYPPHGAPPGFLNDKGDKGRRTILPDPDRLPIVTQVFEMFLSGKYSAQQLYHIAVDKMGLTTAPRKKVGGKKMSRSAFYTMLKDPVYAGFFFGKDDDDKIIRYTLNKFLPRIIDEQEHNRVISLLSRSGNPRPWSHKNEYPYKQFAKCGKCNGTITVDTKVQMYCYDCKVKTSIIKDKHCKSCGRHVDDIPNKTIKHNAYHRCCNKKTLCAKTQGSKEEAAITNALIEDYVQNIAISPALKAWCVSRISILEQEEKEKGKTIEKNWRKRLAEADEQLERLLDAHLRGAVTSKEHDRRKATIEAKRDALRAKFGLSENIKIDMQEVERKFDILTEFEDILKNGTFEAKVEALSALGSNLTITREKVSVSKGILYQAIEKGLRDAKLEDREFEPNKNSAVKRRLCEKSLCSRSLLRELDSNQRPTG